jgi:transposase-like protein
MSVDLNKIDLDNIYQEIVRLSEDSGLNLTQLCRQVNVSRSVLERWKKETPKSLAILSKMLKVIDSAKERSSNVVKVNEKHHR